MQMERIDGTREFRENLNPQELKALFAQSIEDPAIERIHVYREGQPNRRERRRREAEERKERRRAAAAQVIIE
jgi:hypothetical protein